ncbi:family 43 glycosylhydrolase [Sabulibacter ruber]|uniref:glycoside hydrolase family 43 protein n=1 Tax=Sabulibacter ruber TaxID=2811901 RepID=UPI001A96A30B|nr:glycoside hydrolase family 43 protein [Sabulibacter ruber]
MESILLKFSRRLGAVAAQRIFLYAVFLQLSVVAGCKQEAVLPAKSAIPPAKEEKVTFTNPLLATGPDPWVIRRDSLYYYTHTVGNNIVLYKTRAVSQLRDAPVKTVWNPPAAGANSQNIWAPELHFLDGKWYMYYTAGASPDLSTQRSFVLENSSASPLEGSWVEKGKVADPAADFFSIDGTILEHEGARYFIWSGHVSATDNTQRLFIARMTNPWTLEGARVEISAPRYAWEQVGLPSVNEGPEILKNKEGDVFLVYSASGCWTDDYALGLMRLKKGGDPMKPADWTKKDTPVFTKKPESKAYGPGHNGFFKSPDGTEDWIIYHANNEPGQGCSGARNPRMQKVNWNTDGTPNFGEPVKIYTEVPRPSGEVK